MECFIDYKVSFFREHTIQIQRDLQQPLIINIKLIILNISCIM